MAEDWRHKYQSHRIGLFDHGVAAVYFKKVRWWGRVDAERIVGYVNQQGEEVVPPGKYDEVGDFHVPEHLAGVGLNGKYGFVDKEGNEYWDMTDDEARRQIMRNRWGLE